MIVYVVGTALSVLFTKLASSPYITNGKKLSDGFLKLFEVLAVLPLVLIAGFRVNVGTDYPTYVMAYEQPEIFSEHFGQGFMLFLYALRYISVNPRIFFIASSIFIYAPFVHTALKESDNPAFSVLFLVISEDYFVSMNGICQYMAIAIIWLAIAALRKGKLIKALILCFLAAQFHRTALCFLVAVLMYKLPLSLKKIAILTAIACVAGIIGRKYLVALIIKYTSYGNYFSSDYANNQLSVALPMMLIYVVIFFTTMILGDQKELNKRPECRIFVIAVLLCISVMALSYVLTENTYRLTYTFIGMIGFYFPAALKTFKTNKNRIIVEAAVVVLFTIWTTMLITHNNQNALPYYSILQL